MNLTGDPWIPVVLASGESRLVSLANAFSRGDQVLDLVATPPQRIALIRLLVCIAQAALDGPEDEEEWRTCRDRIAPCAVEYLKRWRDRFELYGENAFLQLPNLAATDNATLDKLDFSLAAGNNAVLFDHEAAPDGRQQSAAWSALMLGTYQCFSPGGTIGATSWGGTATSRNSEHSPCLEGSMLHTVVRGPCLLATVHMNLLTKSAIGRAPNAYWGTPSWEQMPSGPEDPGLADLTGSYLGRLAPLARGIRLRETTSKATLVDGLRYPKLPYREPAATVVRRRADDQLAYLGINLSRHPWRDLGSILASSSSPSEGGAWVLSHLAPGDGTVDLWTGGLAANKGKLLDVAEWSFVLPLALVGTAELSKYRRGAQLAETGSSRLRLAVARYFHDLSFGEFGLTETGTFRRNDKQTREHRGRVLATAEASYWRTLDGAYGALIETANDPVAELGGTWYSLVRAAMNEAYERACPHESPRQIRAFAKGAQRLRVKKPE